MNEELPRKHGVTATKRGGRAAVRPRSHRSGSDISDPAWPRRQVRAVRLQTNGRRSVSCIADGRRSPPCRQVTNVIATERHAGERPPFARPLNVFKLQRHTRNDHRPAPDRDPLASWPPGYFRRTASPLAAGVEAALVRLDDDGIALLGGQSGTAERCGEGNEQEQFWQGTMPGKFRTTRGPLTRRAHQPRSGRVGVLSRQTRALRRHHPEWA